MSFIRKLTKLLIFSKGMPDSAGLVMYSDHIGKHVMVDGYYEKDLVQAILNSLAFDTSTATAIDVGANIGNHTRLFSNRFKLVRSFEPQKRTYRILDLNTELYDGIEIYNFGLSSKPGDFEINVPLNNNGSGSTDFSFEDDVPVIRELITCNKYDDLFNDDVGFVKVDVEGHERAVFESMVETLTKYKPVIAFELHPGEDSSVQSVDYLCYIGYSRFFTAAETPLQRFNRSQNFFVRLVRKGLTVLNLRSIVSLVLDDEITRLEEISIPDLIRSRYKYNLVVADCSDSEWKVVSNAS